MKRFCSSVAFTVALAAISLPAAAQLEAFTVRDVDVFAGPSGEFPPIGTLAPNTEVRIAGCLSNWSWCDVIFPKDRGWVYAADLAYPYHNQRVVIIDNGSRLGLPVVTFSLEAYWSAHYRSRTFYAQRQQWESRVHVQADRGGAPPQGHAQARGRAEERAGAPQAGRPQAQAAQPQGAERERARPEANARAPEPNARASEESARAAEQSARPSQSAARRSEENAKSTQPSARPTEENARQQQGARQSDEAMRQQQAEQSARQQQQGARATEQGAPPRSTEQQARSTDKGRSEERRQPEESNRQPDSDRQ